MVLGESKKIVDRKILAIIPARSGSKSIPHKNIMSVNGKPLLVYSIEHALASQYINRVLVSTDSEIYAGIARANGAETPFLRPDLISQDLSTDYEVFYHALSFLKENEGYTPDLVVHLRPTSPIRNPADIDKMIELLFDNDGWDSIRSVAPSPESPYKMWLEEGGVLIPVIASEIREPYNQPRQALPTVYLQNASIDITRPRTIFEMGSMTGKVIGAFKMENNYDIDHLSDLEKLRKTNFSQVTGKTFCFDIDGVIACLTKDNNYELCSPNEMMIEKVNRLFENGNHIILFTARGSKTGIDWQKTTASQMERWGVKYHELRFGKPAADYYVDDRLINIDQI